jgi:hypothetical protein
MTHIKNIPHILEYGITHKYSPNANPDYVAIGDTSLINTRETKRVNISNGDRSQSYSSIILGKFIPFYFGTRMPMLYVIQHGGNYVERATLPEDIIYLVCNLNDIVRSGATYYFSDGHATDNLTSFYDSSKILELPYIIDWSAVTFQYWSGNENNLIKTRKQAELLLANDIALQYLRGFICYNESARRQLTAMGVESKRIRIDSQAYY